MSLPTSFGRQTQMYGSQTPMYSGVGGCTPICDSEISEAEKGKTPHYGLQTLIHDPPTSPISSRCL